MSEWTHYIGDCLSHWILHLRGLSPLVLDLFLFPAMAYTSILFSRKPPLSSTMWFSPYPFSCFKNIQVRFVANSLSWVILEGTANPDSWEFYGGWALWLVGDIQISPVSPLFFPTRRAAGWLWQREKWRGQHDGGARLTHLGVSLPPQRSLSTT
jgi:hypothetical protein